jgi:hypothetical protein
LYLCLYAEVQGESTKAEAYWRQCVQTDYYRVQMARPNGDYMTALAQVRNHGMHAYTHTTEHTHVDLHQSSMRIQGTS